MHELIQTERGQRVRALGVNRVALEVDSVDAAIEWLARFLVFELRGRKGGRAWIDLGDEFIALSEPRTQPADASRHFGLVVDDKEALRKALRKAGVSVPGTGSLRFANPGGTTSRSSTIATCILRVPAVLASLGSGELQKSHAALEELRQKGSPEPEVGTGSEAAFAAAERSDRPTRR